MMTSGRTILLYPVSILMVFNLAVFSIKICSEKLDPECNMSMREIVTYHGYPYEEYEILSKDGYYTWIQRIPYGKVNTDRTKRKPVIVQHGILGSSIVWVANVPTMNLAYILAEEGYDVWLTNARGDAYSLHHKKYKKSQLEFWLHDWHEMGYYDMAAFIDFILAKTGYSQLLYVGHSMGTTIAFVLLAEKPEYNKKVKAAFMLAPVVTLSHLTSVAGKWKGYTFVIQWLENLGLYYLNPENPLPHVLLSFLYQDALRLNKTRVPLLLSLGLSTVALQAFIHYGQVMESGIFRQFDHGNTDNFKYYNQSTPPEYNMSAVTTAVYVYYCDNDQFSSDQDVADLLPRLVNLKKTYHIPDPLFNHFEFMFGLNVKRLLYNRLLKDMKSAWP